MGLNIKPAGDHLQDFGFIDHMTWFNTVDDIVAQGLNAGGWTTEAQTVHPELSRSN